jgi:predicted MFS family arabinose efflux permease
MLSIGRQPMIKRRSEWPLDLYKLVLGASLVLSPWLFGFVYKPASLDAWTIGSILVALSVAALLVFNDWKEWAALALGLWLILAPWVLGLPHLATKVHVIAGLVCAYLAGLELWLVHFHDPSGKSS